MTARTRVLMVLASAAILNPLSTVHAEGPAPQPASASGIIEGSLISLSPGGDRVDLELPAPLGARGLSIADQKTKDKLAAAQKGDILRARLDSGLNPDRIVAIEQVSRPVSPWVRFVTLGISCGVLILIATAATRASPQSFAIGADNRYSNSKCQLLLWFGAVASVYLAAVALRILYIGWGFVGGVSLTTNLIALTGLSAFTFGGARVITQAKVNDATAGGITTPKTLGPQHPPTVPNLLNDLVQDDLGRADLGDFEMILVTLAAVGIFVLSAFTFLGSLELEKTVTLPDVDTALLSGFGLGQGAYLIKKAAANLGEG